MLYPRMQFLRKYLNPFILNAVKWPKVLQITFAQI